MTSDLLTINSNEQNDSRRRGRLMQTEVTTGDDDIPIIDGIRVPDDPLDKRVYRNAR